MWWRGTQSRWGFSFTFWLAHFNVLALPPLFSLNALQLPGPFSCGGYYTLQLLHIVHLVIALSTTVDGGYRNYSGVRQAVIGLVFG